MSTNGKSVRESRRSNPKSNTTPRAGALRDRRGSALALLGAVLAAMLSLLLVGCGVSGGPGGNSNTGPAATATATPSFPLPYSESAPGCGPTAAAWSVQAAAGLSCPSSPLRLHLTGEPYVPTSACCENEIELGFGPTNRLSSTFQVTVDVAGMPGQTHSASDFLTARLTLRLRPDKDLEGPSPIFMVALNLSGDGSASYRLGLSGQEGDGTFDAAALTQPMAISITVGAHIASITLNGETLLYRAVANPVSVEAIALQVAGPSGASVEFSNFMIEGFTGDPSIPPNIW